jgi:hypothetical protein
MVTASHWRLGGGCSQEPLEELFPEMPSPVIALKKLLLADREDLQNVVMGKASFPTTCDSNNDDWVSITSPTDKIDLEAETHANQGPQKWHVWW